MTLGADGSRIHVDGDVLAIPAVRPDALVDPTGCGDAYRAGLLYGIAHGHGTGRRTGRLASVLGSLKIGRAAARTTPSDRDAVGALYHREFGSYPW